MNSSVAKKIYKICVCFLCRIRAYGSAAVNLCHVAAGRGQGYVEYGIHIWDFIAGALIAAEAGAVVLDPTGDIVCYTTRFLFSSSYVCVCV